MEFENRQPREGINISKESSLKQFVRLLAAAIFLFVVLFVATTYLGGWLARLVPFSAEVAAVESMGINFDELFESDQDDPLFVQRETELADLASRVMAHMDIPEDMSITVHYVDDEVINAFATLGGHVFIFRGLIEQMPHENALAMVMAHEIAHELHRDPISGLGGKASAQVAMSAIFRGSGSLSSVLDTTMLVGGVTFTRGMEARADTTAIEAVNGLYGHVVGADALFRLLAERSAETEGAPNRASTFLRTHPLDQNRVDAIQQAAKANGWLMEGDTTPLTPALASLSVAALATDHSAAPAID